MSLKKIWNSQPILWKVTAKAGRKILQLPLSKFFFSWSFDEISISAWSFNEICVFTLSLDTIWVYFRNPLTKFVFYRDHLTKFVPLLLLFEEFWGFFGDILQKFALFSIFFVLLWRNLHFSSIFAIHWRLVGFFEECFSVTHC